MRVCISCQRRLGEDDFLADTSRRMEADRISLGLEGVSFRFYSCPHCGHDHVFLEAVRLPGETRWDFQNRIEALTRAAQEIEVAETTILVVEQGD
jgi:hypothetical protein